MTLTRSQESLTSSSHTLPKPKSKNPLTIWNGQRPSKSPPCLFQLAMVSYRRGSQMFSSTFFLWNAFLSLARHLPLSFIGLDRGHPVHAHVHVHVLVSVPVSVSVSVPVSDSFSASVPVSISVFVSVSVSVSVAVLLLLSLPVSVSASLRLCLCLCRWLFLRLPR